MKRTSWDQRTYLKITYAYSRIILITAALLTLALVLAFAAYRTRPQSLPKAPPLSGAEQELDSSGELTPQPTLPQEGIEQIKEKLPPEIPVEAKEELERVLRGE